MPILVGSDMFIRDMYVKNKDLWIELYNLNETFDVKWNWVKAHAGNTMNEKVDQLAKKAAILK